MSRVWTHDGTWHRLDAGTYSIEVLDANPEAFELATDVEVACSGRRWSATLVTPEQVRDYLTRWAVTGDGTYFWVPDGIVVADLTLATIEAVVRDHMTDDLSRAPPFVLLLEEQEG